MKKIIVNADDFGLAKGINNGIIYGFHKGIISSASISINGREYKEAIALAKENPGLDIGLHITLTQEQPISHPQEIKSLVGNNGLFCKSIYDFLLRYLLGKINLEEVRREISAQFDKISGLGINVTHVDSHQHVHILPGIIDIVIEMCRKYKIKFIRCPYGPLDFKKLYRIDRFLPQSILNMLCLSVSKKIRRNNLKTCDKCFGFTLSGNLNKAELKKIIFSLNDGLYEIVCHPAITDSDLLTRYGYWRYNWDEELKVLCSAELRNFIDDNSVSAVNYNCK